MATIGRFTVEESEVLGRARTTTDFRNLYRFFKQLDGTSQTNVGTTLQNYPGYRFPVLRNLTRAVDARKRGKTICISSFTQRTRRPLPTVDHDLHRLRRSNLILHRTSPTSQHGALIHVAPRNCTTYTQYRSTLDSCFTYIVTQLAPRRIRRVGALHNTLVSTVLTRGTSHRTGGGRKEARL